MVFGNGVKNIQAAAYNGARTVHTFCNRLWNQFGRTLPVQLFKKRWQTIKWNIFQKWGTKSTPIMNSPKLVKKGRLKLRPVSFSGQVLHSLREIEQSLATWTMDMWWGLFFENIPNNWLIWADGQVKLWGVRGISKRSLSTHFVIVCP